MPNVRVLINTCLLNPILNASDSIKRIVGRYRPVVPYHARETIYDLLDPSR